MYCNNNDDCNLDYIINNQLNHKRLSTDRLDRILEKVIQNINSTKNKIGCRRLQYDNRQRQNNDRITVVNRYSEIEYPHEMWNSRRYPVDDLNVEMERFCREKPKLEKKCNNKKVRDCYVTDEEREEEKRIENPLPYWHISEAASNMKDKAIRRNLNCGKRSDLNDYLEMRTAKEREEQFNGKYRQTKKHVKMESGPGYHRMHAISSETLVEPLPEQPRREIERVQRYQRNTQICDRIHECRPFYGTVETERACSAAIDHIINLQKELNKLQFTTGCILPQSQKFIDSVDSIHIALKQFNNHFRRLKDASDDILGQKTGIQLTVTMDKSGKAEDVQFPIGGLSERQKSRK